MKEIINSVGIDIGTSTTQLIFSKLTIENRATSYTVPRIQIVDTDVVYRSKIYFTPLSDDRTIDAEKIKDIVVREYNRAGMKPEDLHTGAVIITGETARKENANDVLNALSCMAGDFVVSTAGPDLESVLAAKGAGTDVISKENRNTVANVDIGGGTSNIAVFKKGALLGVSCLDIGGRLIRVQDGKIAYIYKKIKELAESQGIRISVGDKADIEKLKTIASIMAGQLAMAVGLKQRDVLHRGLYTNDGSVLSEEIKIDGVTFSGGVADIIYEPEGVDLFRYGDIGPLLGKAVLEEGAFLSVRRFRPTETIRATVVGAGTHTTEVSGSTICYDARALPVKNIPVIKMEADDEKALNNFSRVLAKKINIFAGSGLDECVAIGISGKYHTSFDAIQEMAQAILEGERNCGNKNSPLVVIAEHDIGKVLGNALKTMSERSREIISIDNVFVKDGDYVDIGEPVGGGRVVPVVTKTLIFNR